MSEGLPPTLNKWEERWHPLREEWVVIAAHRQHRPWTGATIAFSDQEVPEYIADCYLCPGNTRVSGAHNPTYTDIYIFDNDHPCVGQLAPEQPPQPTFPYKTRSAQGYARVVCYSPKHNQALAELALPAIENVVQAWQQQTVDLGKRAGVQHVLCFENKGTVVGVSNPHPHGQIYATNFVFKTIETELLATQRFQQEHGQTLFASIIAAEQQDGRRILYEDDYTIAFIPYFARYAYEVYIAPKRTVPYVSSLGDAEVASLAKALKEISVRFDNLWQMPFPYVLSLHQAPTDFTANMHVPYHFFIAIHPPLRQPSMLKYLAGPEIGGGNFISDTLPEEKAAELLAVSSIHYKERTEVQR